MKRLSSSDSLNALVSICPNSTDEQNPMYTREFQAMLEGLDEEESLGGGPKKRRLSVDQVKALEKNFEVENKLEPERKVKLAQELGLQPRQVAVWFQNRRARWKTKQLEKDYGVLKASYDGLKLNFDKLQRDNESLIKQIGELKAKAKQEQPCNLGAPLMAAFTDQTKDGGGSSDDSNSSAVLKKGSSMSSSVDEEDDDENVERDYFPVKLEEHNFLGEEESCSTSLIFADDQAPTLHWYCADEWELKEML